MLDELIHTLRWNQAETKNRLASNAYRIGSFWLDDTLVYPDGRTIALPRVYNQIQTSFGLLLAALASGKNTTAITYMENGSGNPSWDASPPPPAPGTANTALINPIARSVALTGASWTYLNPDNTTAGGSTARVQMTTTFGVGTSNGTLREVALWGGAGATATLSTGTLVNIIRHAPIDKPAAADFALTRRLTLQF